MFFQALFARLLRLYPTHFRDEFASEMQTVFSESLGDARKLGKRSMFSLLVREMVHLPAWALLERLQGWKKTGVRKILANSTSSPDSQNPVQQVEPPVSTLTILLGLFPILLLGLWTISAAAQVRFLWSGWVNFPILYTVALVAAGVAWYLGSPRWSYSYAGFLLVFTWYLEGFQPPGFIAAWLPYLRYGELWGKWIWAPLLITLVIVLLARRSWVPFRQFCQHIRRDWTLYTFIFYSAMPWFCWALFDEIRDQTLVIVSVLITDLSLWIGALFYLKARTINRRALSLFCGMLPAILITVIATSAYWHGRQEPWMISPGNGYADALRGFIFFAVILLILFFPALIDRIKHKKWSLRST
jgi:hypothetical protein